MSGTATLAPPAVYREPHSDRYAPVMVKRVLRGIQEMRLQVKAVFAGVEKGEHAVFTRRGKPVAVLVPIEWYRVAAKAVNDPTEF